MQTTTIHSLQKAEFRYLHKQQSDRTNTSGKCTRDLKRISIGHASTIKIRKGISQLIWLILRYATAK